MCGVLRLSGSTNLLQLRYTISQLESDIVQLQGKLLLNNKGENTWLILMLCLTMAIGKPG